MKCALWDEREREKILRREWMIKVGRDRERGRERGREGEGEVERERGREGARYRGKE